MDAINAIAHYIHTIDYNKLPPEVVQATKNLIMDSVAVALAGSAETGVAELADIFREWGGKEESTLWVYGDRLPCLSAAQANAVMIHALDYDDTHDAAVIHTGVVAIPTAIAVAERIGGVDGKKLITSVTVAVDLAARLCLANTVSMFERGWHYTTLHGNFSAVAAAGKLLDLDEETLIHAFGLAYHQACGNLQALHDGALAKREGPGFSARNGIMAVLMAQKGITGARNVLEGRDGFFNVYHRGDYRPGILTSRLGEEFENPKISFKPYPCCRANHTSIDAALALVREHTIKPDDIDHIVVRIGKGGMKVVGEPVEVKQNPATTVDAQFSTPWTVASAIVHGKVGIAEFTKDAIKDKRVLALSNRVTPTVDDSLTRLAVGPTVVEITMKNGKTYSKQVDIPYGSPENPMSMEAMALKMRDCASYAAKPMSADNVERLIQQTAHLEGLPNVREFVQHMT